MSSTVHIRGFVRPDAGLDPDAQHRALVAAGVSCRATYEQGRGGETLAVAIRSLGPGDELAVLRAYLLVDVAKVRDASARRIALWDIMGAVDAAGAVVWEVESGRKSATTHERDGMIADAIEVFARSRVRGLVRKAGRPRRVWTDSEREIVVRHWHDLRHATNKAAIKAMAADGVKISETDAWRVAGPSGRREKRSK